MDATPQPMQHFAGSGESDSCRTNFALSGSRRARLEVPLYHSLLNLTVATKTKQGKFEAMQEPSGEMMDRLSLYDAKYFSSFW